MINGLDWAFISPQDMQLVINGQLPVDFVWVRARDGFRDDGAYQANAKLLKTATNPAGAVLWGPYMYLNYNPGSVEGDDQAKQTWDLVSAGGVEWQLPIAIDAERSASGPLPAAKYYFDTRLMPAIEYLSAKMNRRPVLYSNPDFLLNYAKPLLSLAAYKAVTECPLWVADWNKTQTAPSYWLSIERLGYWKSWLAWQYKGDVGDWPGISDVDLNRGQGTRAQWKAWAADGGPLPIEGAVVPPPVEPPVDPPAGDLVALSARVTAIEGRLDRPIGR